MMPFIQRKVWTLTYMLLFNFGLILNQDRYGYSCVHPRDYVPVLVSNHNQQVHLVPCKTAQH
jgi:hypothetical protein